MRVKKLISFYENQHYFTILFVHNFLSRWLNESFPVFCISHVKIQKNWFILVHLRNPSFYSFLQLIGLPVFWRWHHLPVPPHHQLPQADNWWGNQRWQIHLIQLPLNEQRGTTKDWSFPFVRCIHSDYITWLSKWLCMHIIPSFLVDKASCTRQFESQLSLHSLASLFPIKEGIFLPLRLSCKERLFSKTYPSFLTLKEGSTSHLGLLPSGKKKETALLGARNRYAIRLTGHQSPRQIVRDGTAWV